MQVRILRDEARIYIACGAFCFLPSWDGSFSTPPCNRKHTPKDTASSGRGLYDLGPEERSQPWKKVRRVQQHPKTRVWTGQTETEFCIRDSPKNPEMQKALESQSRGYRPFSTAVVCNPRRHASTPARRRRTFDAASPPFQFRSAGRLT